MIYFLPSLTVLLIFACLVAWQYIASLKAENAHLKSENETTWKLYDGDHRELRAIKGQHVTLPYFTDESKNPETPIGAIGPSQARDRQHRKDREAQESSRPPFREPTEAEILEAARRASNGGTS